MSLPLPKGRLRVIGGHEEKEGDTSVLEVFVKHATGPIVVTTAASRSSGAELFAGYRKVFRELGAHEIRHVDIASRLEAACDEAVAKLADARAVFFTGGDQLRITSQLGDTPVYRRVEEIYRAGGIVAGTSAGASVMSSTMLVAGGGRRTPRLGETVRMAPGLGLLPGVIVDQHFAERGRLGRLLGAVAQNPANIGLGVDEDTAFLVEQDTFTVLGAGAVYVVDGRAVTRSNLVEGDDDCTLSIFDVKLHVLAAGDRFHLDARRPEGVGGEEALGLARAEEAPQQARARARRRT